MNYNSPELQELIEKDYNNRKTITDCQRAASELQKKITEHLDLQRKIKQEMSYVNARDFLKNADNKFKLSDDECQLIIKCVSTAEWYDTTTELEKLGQYVANMKQYHPDMTLTGIELMKKNFGKASTYRYTFKDANGIYFTTCDP